MKAYSVIIADGHQVVRDAITAKMQSSPSEGGPNFDLKAIGENGIEAIALVK